MTNIHIQKNIPLRELTTLKVGGAAQWYAVADSEQKLDEAVGYATENNLPITLLGGGSNILVSEKGVEGLTIHIKISGITQAVTESGVLLTAGAGETLDDVVRYAVERGYWGLENLSHIPGTVGAAPVQNVGAYGVEAKDLISSVRVYNIEQRKYEVLTPEECQFAYRDSIFKKEVGAKYIIASVTFALETEPSPRLQYKDLQNRFTRQEPSLQQVRDAVIEIRSNKFPDWREIGTAGSFFKNPIITKEKFEELSLLYPEMPSFPVDNTTVKVPLGWILDKVLHLKGEGTQKVGTYQGQALVIINKADAKADDIIEFAQKIEREVHEIVGINIQWEVTRVGCS